MRILLSILLLMRLSEAPAQSRPSFRYDSCDFSAVGHRGYPLIFPENSLLGIEMAFRHGVKICEIDVSVTKDDKYVLFHDESALHRTTNGSGKITDISYDSLKLLDAGSWKGAQFKNVYIPTLEEALLVAQKYKAQLYLDTKAHRPDLMKKALESTGVDPERIIIPLASVAEAQEFHKLLPNTPWLWYDGGLYPQQLTNDQFYKDCILNGCQAFEVAGFDDTDTIWPVFESIVHSNGGKVWVFTDNTNQRADYLYVKHVDGIETDRAPAYNRYLCAGIKGEFPDSFTTGDWRFRNNMHSKGIGSQLRPKDYVSAPPSMMPQFGTCSQFGISLLDSNDEEVMLVPAQDAANGILVYTNFVPENYGIREGSFTVMMDFLVRASDANKWIALFQTTIDNSDDADLFINPSGQIGTISKYHGQVNYGQWNRLVFTIDVEKQELRKYLNGNFIGMTPTYGTRWLVANASPRGENQGFLLFSDNNSETVPVYLSALQIRDYIMDSNSVKKFGATSRNGFRSGNADLFNVEIPGAISDSTLIDYDNQVYYLMVPEFFNLSNCKLNFDLSANATADIVSGSDIDFSSGQITMHVMSEDSMRYKTWTIVVDKQLPTSLHEQNNLLSKSLAYPNPAGDVLTVKGTGITGYTFFDTFGRSGLTGNMDTSDYTINTSALAEGIYFLTLEHRNGEHKTIKVLIQR